MSKEEQVSKKAEKWFKQITNNTKHSHNCGELLTFFPSYFSFLY
jgi:hypothetical protein